MKIMISSYSCHVALGWTLFINQDKRGCCWLWWVCVRLVLCVGVGWWWESQWQCVVRQGQVWALDTGDARGMIGNIIRVVRARVISQSRKLWQHINNTPAPVQGSESRVMSCELSALILTMRNYKLHCCYYISECLSVFCMYCTSLPSRARLTTDYTSKIVILIRWIFEQNIDVTSFLWL